MPVHHAAADGFAKKADAYVRGRPEYPAEIDVWLRGVLGLGAGKRGLDLGAGTGKFTVRLLATGAAATAVEPVAEMRARFGETVPGGDVRDGTAEAIPLPDAAFDAVVCAQAFHWFATPSALAEIHRVLKPGGRLGLVWNVRDESVDWVAALSEIMRPFEGDAPRYASGAWRRVFPASGFGPLIERRFPFVHVGPPERVIVDRVMSVSFIAALPPAGQAEVEGAVRRLIAGHPALRGRAEIGFPYVAAAYSCVRAEG
jgi:SAM-dependent methyltransferase